MKLTKLSAAPTLALQAALGRRCRLMPALANGMDAGTASQLIPGVRRTRSREGCTFDATEADNGWSADRGRRVSLPGPLPTLAERLLAAANSRRGIRVAASV